MILAARVYNMALDEFMNWFKLAPRPSFSKATVCAWPVSTTMKGLRYHAMLAVLWAAGRPLVLRR